MLYTIAKMNMVDLVSLLLERTLNSCGHSLTPGGSAEIQIVDPKGIHEIFSADNLFLYSFFFFFFAISHVDQFGEEGLGCQGRPSLLFLFCFPKPA